MTKDIDVALILWNPDVIHLATVVLEQRNLKSGGLEPYHTIQEIEEWVVCCEASVVVFDLGPPYNMSARVALYLLNRFPERSFVFTCADPQLATKVAPALSVHPILRKPYYPEEMGNVVEALVCRALSF